METNEHVIVELIRIGAANSDESCPIERFTGALDGPWATLIIRELLTGPKRFGEIDNALIGISPKTLSGRLKKLAQFDILTREEHGGVPPKVVYELTPRGHRLGPVLYEMAMWATDHVPDDTPARNH